MKFIPRYFVIVFLLSCKSGQIKPEIMNINEGEQLFYIHHEHGYEKNLRQSIMRDTVIVYKKDDKK